MLDFFHALSAIPDMIMGMGKWPRATMVAMLCGSILAVSMFGVQYPEEPKRTPRIVNVVQPKEEKPKERRIVRIVKWLWVKD